MAVRTRFAPSPTGHLHIGGARTAIFNWLFARGREGRFILRIEDTDLERSSDEFTRSILDSLSWLGLDWDEGPFYQSQRLERYRELAEKLLDKGLAYRCFCTPEELEAMREEAKRKKIPFRYPGKCRNLKPPYPDRPFSIRFKMPEGGTTSFKDEIRGVLTFDNSQLDDFIIMRSNGLPTYNFAVVVDDGDMGITHVIRGDDHINNTPKQIHLFKVLGYEVPIFAHVPMILGHDKKRLSKRHGATSIEAYRKEGYLPEALFNYLVRLGWSYGDQEIFSIQELIGKFGLDRVGRSAAVFNPDKLLWLNGHYIREKDERELLGLVRPFLEELGIDELREEEGLLFLIKHAKERAKTLKELAWGIEYYFRDPEGYDEKGKAKFLKPKILEPLKELLSLLDGLERWDQESMEPIFRGVVEKWSLKMVELAQPVRLALTGRTVSPGIFDVMFSLGKEKVLKRIKKLIEFMEEEVASISSGD